MGKVSNPVDLEQVPTWEQLRRWVSIYLKDFSREFNGNVDVLDNLYVRLVVAEFVTSGLQVSVPHTLGYIPNGYILVSASAPCSIYDGVNQNTNDILYLRSNAAAKVKLLLF